ncbi:glycerate dehydrogenase like [Lecanosticta acicola]|uniref:Glycerate dehydrogenase like n=1 Tax=Lecanosticta acicola TaxID=111012 RepID=A0AAI8Z520_9PEZI|nr:glycerate dehydrogenase like [Lecanosticta acicola]
MKVPVAERKRASQIRHGHAALDQAFREGFVSISAMPPDNSTRNMFSEAEFQSRNCTSSIINVGRGGVINEKDSGTALRNRDIAGAATNVFEQWPATKSYSPLLDETILNLVLNPHVAWLSSKTIQCTIATAEPNIEGFVAGKPHNLA